MSTILEHAVEHYKPYAMGLMSLLKKERSYQRTWNLRDFQAKIGTFIREFPHKKGTKWTLSAIKDRHFCPENYPILD